MSDEKKLVIEAQSGNMNAFRELVVQYQQQIYFLALDLSGNHDDASDLSQEAFIRAFRFIGKFRREAKFSSWLYRITVNCYIDSRRKKQLNTIPIHNENRETEATGQRESALPDQVSHTPEQLTAAKGIQQHIQAALRQLSDRERSVFVLRHYQEMPLKEISAVLDIAEGTVKALLFRAIRRLQKELAFYQVEL